MLAVAVMVMTGALANAQVEKIRPTLSLASSSTWEYMLHLEGVQGEATGGYADWIIATGFHQLMQRPTAESGAATGRPVVNPITIYKRIDRASPKLYDLCLRGGRITTGILQMNPKATPAHLLRLELQDIFIVSVETRGSALGEPVEIIKLAPASIRWRYRTGEGGDSCVSDWRRDARE